MLNLQRVCFICQCSSFELVIAMFGVQCQMCNWQMPIVSFAFVIPIVYLQFSISDAQLAMFNCPCSVFNVQMYLYKSQDSIWVMLNFQVLVSRRAISHLCFSVRLTSRSCDMSSFNLQLTLLKLRIPNFAFRVSNYTVRFDFDHCQNPHATSNV